MEKKSDVARVMFDNCLLYNEQIFFVARYMNIICSFDIKEKKTKIIGEIPEECIKGYRLSTSMHIHKDKLILAPCAAKKIWVCDLQNNEWHSIEIRDYGTSYMEYKIFQSVAYEEKFYMIGSNYPAIICMDMETEDIEYVEIFEHLKDNFKQKKDCFLRSDYVRVADSLYMASCLSNEVLKFDMKTKHFEWIEVGSSENRYSGIVWDGEKFWLSPRINTPIVIWNGDNKFDEIELPGKYNNTFNFLGITYFSGYIIIPGLLCDKTLYINTNNVKDVKMQEGQYIFVGALDEKRLFGQKRDGQFFVTDNMFKTEYFDIVVSSEQMKSHLNSCGHSVLDLLIEEVYQEDGLANLQMLCDDIQQKNININRCPDNGKHIWEIITTL